MGPEVHPSGSNVSFFPATVIKIKSKELTKSKSWKGGGEGWGQVDLVEEHPIHLGDSCYK